MMLFATEFPLSGSMERSTFVSEIVEWLRGTDYSTVLGDSADADLDGLAPLLRSHTGEELRIRELQPDGSGAAIGFRHDYPDGAGRLWRTEAVLRRRAAVDGQDLLRVRTQCSARRPGVRLEMPRKPFLVKRVLRNDWGGKDGLIDVIDDPHWLTDDEDAIELARDILVGGVSRSLPQIYVSAIGTGRWRASRRSIEKLAYDLGGVAHVFAEPNRAFSFRLREVTGGSNVYGGTIGVALPGLGLVRRFYIGWQLPDEDSLMDAVSAAAIALRTQMPADGWDWTELQDHSLRRQREHDRQRLTAEESERLYLEEISNLQDRIGQLQEELATRAVAEAPDSSLAFLPSRMTDLLGQEIYPGEFSDRLRLAAKIACDVAEQVGLDKRSRSLLEAAVARLPVSPALIELLEDLKRATKDPKRVSSNLTALLSRHGYAEKSDNRHVRLEAGAGYLGLDSVTVPKTPSDSRGLQNLRTQVERTLGIAKLAEKTAKRPA